MPAPKTGNSLMVERLQSGPKRSNDRLSALGGSSSQAADNPALQEDVGEQDRHHGDQDAGRQSSVVVGELALEVQQPDRNGLVSVRAQQDQSEQELVPGSHRIEDEHRDEGRS